MCVQCTLQQDEDARYTLTRSENRQLRPPHEADVFRWAEECAASAVMAEGAVQAIDICTVRGARCQHMWQIVPA